MQFHEVKDWDDAYANADHIPGASKFIANWPRKTERFRNKLEKAGKARFDVPYGPRKRNRLDLFFPDKEPKGLLVFVHGGYWMRFDKSLWSWLASGALARGYAVAMPSYTLCPEVTISEITREVGKAVQFAAKQVAGPITLAGHSAGGHLVARMICNKSPVRNAVRSRIVHTMPISCVSDLRPLCCLKLNQTLRLTDREADRESPALLTPVPNARITCWVGANERTEFIRQNALLANIWHGLGARIGCVEESDRHHFDVIEGLADPDSGMCRVLFGGSDLPSW